MSSLLQRVRAWFVRRVRHARAENRGGYWGGITMRWQDPDE